MSQPVGRGQFAELAGQDAVVAQLAKASAGAAAVLAGKRPDPGAMTHAWLFTGPPGSGRSVAARAFAAALLCPSGGCGHCPSCLQVQAGTHADLLLVRPEGLSYGVKQTRDLVLRAAGAPAGGRWQVVVFEDADRCTEQAANALLKAIEEPTPRTVWLLCAPSAEDLVPTIRSRCRVVTLVVPASAAVAKVLMTRDGIEPAAALAAARAAQGHVGRARRLALDASAAARRADVLRVPLAAVSLGPALSAAASLGPDRGGRGQGGHRGTRRAGTGVAAPGVRRGVDRQGRGQGHARHGRRHEGPGGPAEVPRHPGQARHARPGPARPGRLLPRRADAPGRRRRRAGQRRPAGRPAVGRRRVDPGVHPAPPAGHHGTAASASPSTSPPCWPSRI